MSKRQTRFWKEMAKAKRERRKQRREEREKTFLKLEAEGFEVKRITPYQYRINGLLDIYTTHGKYHDLTEEYQVIRQFPQDAMYDFVHHFFQELAMRGK